MRTKLTSLMLAVLMLASTLALCVSAEDICLHDTKKGLVKTDDGYTVANVCTICKEAVTEIGYVKDSNTITLYKDSGRSTAYTSAELKTGFKGAAGTTLFAPSGLLINTGKPYWFSFDLKVNSLPTLADGHAQANLDENNSRANKGCSLICTVPGGSYLSQLRVIYDGWEADSGANGTTGATPDGKVPVKLYAADNGFRNTETVITLEKGDSLHFDMHLDPSTGAYDVYVDGFYAASGNTGTASNDSSSHIRLWEYDGKTHGGDFDFTNIEIFYDDYTKIEHYHSYTEYTEFYDKGVYRYESCVCGMRNELECDQITSVVADGLANIYDGLGNFTLNADSYWFVTDMSIKGEIGNGSLLRFGDTVILEAKDGKILSGSAALGAVSYPQTYQLAVEIKNGKYNLYINGKYAVSGTVANTIDITCGDVGFDSHVGFMYNKAVTLGKTDSPVIPTYTADAGAKICYHSDEGTNAKNKILAHTKDGVEYIYNCALCGERVYAMLKKDLTNPANDVAYKYAANALMRDELNSFETETPRYLYLENNVISKTAAPYWLTFDVTPSILPSNETGDLDDPNTRAYKGYGLVSTEASFMPATELRVIPDGWESGNASGTTKGVTDGKCEVHIIAPLEGFEATTEAKVDSFNYRRSETVAYLEVGKTTHFALRIDPRTGNYDVYVDGFYKASSDKPAIQYKKDSTNTVAYDKLVKGQWYNVELYVGKNADGSSRVELKISRGDEVLLDEKYWCPQSVTIDEIRISNGSSRDDADSYCFDNISVSTDHGYNYTEDFENCTEGSSLSEYGWNITCSWGSYNNDDVHVRVAECDVSVRKEAEKVENSNKALYIEDMSNTTYPRAYRSFEPAKSVIAEFDFMLVSDTDYCAAIIGLGDSSIGPKASRGWLAVYPNKDANGNYLGSGNLQYYNGSAYVKTSVTSMMAGTWYNIRLEALAGKNTVAVYVDGAKILDIPVTAKYTEMDRIGFMAGGSDNIGDKFFIDNLVVNTPKPIPATEFEDNLWGLSELPADYTASGEVSLVNGEITLAGVASVNRNFTGVTESGEFSFSIKTSSLEKAAHIAITYDGADKFDLRVREDGALEYRRPTPWEDTWLVVNTMLPAEDGTKYPKQAITAGEWADITLRLAYDRNNNYVMVYVDGEYVGNALYAQSFNNVNGIKVSSVNADATVITKNFKFAFDTTGVFKMPERNQEDAVSYLPLVIEGSRAMYLEGDSKPASGAMSYADGATSIQFNKQYSSMGVDLGEKQQVNALRITTEAPDEATMTSLSSLSYKVYISDNNITYTQIMGRVYNHFLENGKWTALVEFSGIEARYIKLTYSSSTGADNPIIVYPQGNIRPEAKIARQYKMAGDFIEADGIDAEPLCTPMLRNYNTAEGITLTKSMSVGLNMGIVCPVEAVELVGTGLSGLDKNAFKVYVSNDNCVYAPIDDVILSRDTRDGKDVYRLSFDSVDCIYIKLNVVADGVNVKLDTRKDGFAAYSSKEADSKLVQYASVRSGEGDFYTLPDGTIVMLYIGFTQAGDGHDYSNYLVLAKASTDGGATWGEPWIFVALPPEALSVSMAKVFHVEGEPGHMRMVYRLIITRDDGKGYTCEYYFVESFDYGRNWENPQPVIHDIYPDTFGGGSSGNQITRLSNGRILYSNSLYKYQNDDYGGAQTFRQFISGYVYYSDDEGKTWTRSDSTIIMPANCDETSIAELPNGDLLLTLRTRDVNGVHQSISTDNGVTWSQPVAVEGMDSPSSTNTVVTIPATGDVLLIWNNEVWNPANTGGNGIRIPLTMSVTADHGLTYHNYRNLYENSQSWPLIYFYGRNLFVQSSSRNSTMDVALLYHTIDGTKTVADLPKAATPTAVYENGWLTGVTSTMQYSLDGGESWKFCGGSAVELGDVTSLLVKDIGTHELAPSEIQTVK